MSTLSDFNLAAINDLNELLRALGDFPEKCDDDYSEISEPCIAKVHELIAKLYSPNTDPDIGDRIISHASVLIDALDSFSGNYPCGRAYEVVDDVIQWLSNLC